MSENQYADFLRAMVASRTLKESDLEAIEEKRAELEIDDEEHQRVLDSMQVGEQELRLMKNRGALVDEYFDMVVDCISSNFEPMTQVEEMAKFIELKADLSEDDHSWSLNRLGWTTVDFDKVKEGGLRTDTLEPYKVFVRATLEDDSAEFNKEAHNKLVETRRKYGVNDAEHTRCLQEMGMTVDEYHQQRIAKINEAASGLDSVSSDLESKASEAQEALSGVQGDIDKWKQENKPLLDAKDEVQKEVDAKEEDLRPVKAEMKQMQTRLNVIRAKLQRTLDETKALEEEQMALGKSDAQTPAVVLLGNLNAIKADTRDMKEEMERNKVAIETGVIQLKEINQMEATFLNFHRICLAVKISIQNHATSNILVEELWEGAKDLPPDEWHSYVRFKLMPSAKEGFKGTREGGGGLLAWLVNAVTGADKA